MNAALVKIDVAAAALGWSAAKLFDLVDGGTLIEQGFVWVFNLANDVSGQRRDLRFWYAELNARANHFELPKYELSGVINTVLPPARRFFHAGEVDQLFQIRHNTRLALHDELAGSLNSGRNQYARADLAAFLTRRWLGAELTNGAVGPATTMAGRIPSKTIPGSASLTGPANLTKIT